MHFLVAMYLEKRCEIQIFSHCLNVDMVAECQWYNIRTNDAAGISEIHNVDAKLLTNGD